MEVNKENDISYEASELMVEATDFSLEDGMCM